MTTEPDRRAAEERFRDVFRHLAAVTAYARRRGSRDPDGLAAEVMTIAWRRLADVPKDDPRPWLYATARNLVYAERRAAQRTGKFAEREATVPPPQLDELDPLLGVALRALSPDDQEALRLIAWEDLTPAEAARALGINAPAFRVRLLRARRRLRASLERAGEERSGSRVAQLDVEGT